MMTITHDALGLIAVSTLFGAMAFFSFVMAPLIFVKLDAAAAGRFVRGIFPWYFLVVGLLSLMALAALAAVRPVDAAVMALVALGAVASRQALMPRINTYRDAMLAGDVAAEKPFTWLHRLSVSINAAQLLAAATVMIRLAMG